MRRGREGGGGGAGEKGKDRVREKERKRETGKETETDSLKFLEAISVFFSVYCSFTYDVSQCLATILETPLGGAPSTGLTVIKGRPELQRIPAKDPKTAQDLPQPRPTGTMKVNAAAFAVLLAAAALCAPASASPCKSQS